MNAKAQVVGVPIRSNTEVQEGELDPLLSSMSSTVICYVLALVLLVLAKILIARKLQTLDLWGI